MTDYCRNLASEAFVGEPLEPSLDGEIALRPLGATSGPVAGLDTPGRGRWYGRILCGRCYRRMTDLIAEATEQMAACGSKRQRSMMMKSVRHARSGLRHAALARASVLTIILFLVLVASVILAHETRNTVSIYENHLANPGIARAPHQSWGYTPVLYDLPEGLKSNLIALDRSVEGLFSALRLGQSKSGSRSVHSLKLSAAIMSLQAGKARLRRIKAVRAMDCGNVRWASPLGQGAGGKITAAKGEAVPGGTFGSCPQSG